MTRSLQILVFCLFYLTVIRTPLVHGHKVEKGVKKELKLAAITFLKEQWLKLLTPPPKEVRKRDLDSIPPIEKVFIPAPVHEIFEEYKQETANVQENPQMFNYYIKIKENKPPMGLYTNINMAAMEAKKAELQKAELVNGFFGELPPPIIGSLPPIPSQDPVPFIVPLITPPPPPPPTPAPPPEIPPTEGPLVRGSRLALYLGKSFFKMMKQFVKNAKLEIKKIAVPPPAEPVPPPGP